MDLFIFGGPKLNPTLFPAEISYFLLKLKSTIMTLDSTKTY